LTPKQETDWKKSDIMIITPRKRIFFLLLLLSYLLFSYNAFHGWWYSSLGNLLILFFSYLIWKSEFLLTTGLKLRVKTVIISIVLAAVVIVAALLIMKFIAAKRNIIILFTNWSNYFHDIFYTLNEEIILGAIILFWLTRRKKIKPLYASAGLAVFFVLVHYIAYRWIFIDKGIIGIEALSTLFLIGLIRNNLIIITGHIGYSWALHFGWMAVMFGSYHVYTETNLPVSEYMKFNIYLGSAEMLIISFILAGVSLFFLIRHPGTHQHTDLSS
jgi:hypothetical protein